MAQVYSHCQRADNLTGNIQTMKHLSTLSRRNFLRATGASISAFSLVPSHVLGAAGQPPPSERLNIAGIGVGGMGGGNMDGLGSSNNIVALCDVDSRRSEATLAKFPQARQYQDFRKMLDEMDKSIDAVVVSTPDHTHAVAALAAIKRGKHVYCEKPLAHSVADARRMMKAAAQHKVVTQLGNQGHSSSSIRDFCEWIWDGAIGQVHTIHAGCTSVNSGIDRLPRLRETHQVPPTLNWDLWLGPALDRPYSPVYLPGAWRGWIPFGNGTVGDWTCHVVDPVFWALDLGLPKTIQAEVKDYDFKTQPDAFPKGEIITYEFPAKGKRGPITMRWYSGTERIPRPPEFTEEDKPVGTGAVVMGDKGSIVHGSHGAGGLRLIPQEKMDAYKRPERKLPRVRSHHQDWTDAIRNGKKSGSDFSYGCPLSEIALLGVIAIKMAGTKLEWDAEQMRFSNCPEANQYVNPPSRAGWELA
jgi:predicted dehydrogenase